MFFFSPFSPFQRVFTRGWIICVLGLGLLIASGWSQAAEANEPPAPSAVSKPVKPGWNDLSADKQTILAPLAGHWDSLDSINKKKWLAIAKRYPGMQAEDQKRVQERMHEWSQLSPEQRKIARDSYTRIQALKPEQRAALLKTYQSLPEEQKKQLADENRQKSRLLAHQPVKKTPPAVAKPQAASPSSPSTP